MTVHLFVVLLCLHLTEGRLQQDLRLTRGVKDKFTNPKCEIPNTDCAANCAEYFARCETHPCKVCTCDEHWPTYVASEKRCMKDEEIWSHNVPQYSSFAISRPEGEQLITVDMGDSNRGYPKKVRDTNKYTGKLNELWLYTQSQQILNLKTLECLDSKLGPISVQPCNKTSTDTQTWKCDGSHRLYNVKGKKKSYLEHSGLEFFMSDGTQLSKWVPFKNSVNLGRSICDIPVLYQGCYRFKDGSSIKAFPGEREVVMRSCSSEHGCYETLGFSAPIFSDGSSTTCSLIWEDSTFSVNDHPWELLAKDSTLFSIEKNEYQQREYHLQVNDTAKEVWAGALIKLEIECTRDQVEREKHCILLKFNGDFNETLKRNEKTTPTTLKQHTQRHLSPTFSNNRNRIPKSATESKSYKSSTIALAIVLGAILIMAIVATALMCHRRRTRGWVRTINNDDVSAMPFCDTDQL